VCRDLRDGAAMVGFGIRDSEKANSFLELLQRFG
jgi:hypothetical protein